MQGSDLSVDEKARFLTSYELQRSSREERERMIKAITHGLIAVLNIYNGTQQEQESVQTALYFVGGVNLLAAISYSVEF